MSAPISIQTAFGNQSNVNTVWKWNAATSKWAFYTPSLPDGGASYASNQGYEALTTINPGDGFWVNAKAAFTFTTSAASIYSASNFSPTSPTALLTGWNLIAVGDAILPAVLNASFSASAPSVGSYAANVNSIWAWDATKAKWYFYSPTLDNAGTLQKFLTDQGYQDFSTNNLKLQNGVGFWVNNNGSGLTAIAGTVSGLNAGSSILLANGTQSQLINSSGNFSFTVPSNSTYNVSITTQPYGQTCIVSNGTGTATGVNNNITISCNVVIGLQNLVANAINTLTANIISSFNNSDSTSFNSYVDSNFLDSGQTASVLFAGATQFATSNNNNLALSSTSINSCYFNKSGLSFQSTASQLASQTGICGTNANILLSSGSVFPITLVYKFTVDSSGTKVASLKLYGNQFNDSLTVSPLIAQTIRVDGTLSSQGNQGLVSGYNFKIGTGLVNNAVTSKSNMSAIVKVTDSSSNSLGTYYMQCTQASSSNPTHCYDSVLSFCVNNSPTCQGGTDSNNEVYKVGGSVLSLDIPTGTNNLNIPPTVPTGATQIQSALANGPVTVSIKTYNTTLDHVTTSTPVTQAVTVPVVGMPISYSQLLNVNFATLTSSGQAELAAWTGSSTLNLGFISGQMSVIAADFETPTNNSGQTIMVQPTDIQLKFTSIGGGVSKTAVTNTTHTNCSNTDNYRAVYIVGTYENSDVRIKYLGACQIQDY